MLKASKAGKSINENDIPPAVLTSSSRSNSSKDLASQGNDSQISSTIPQSVAFNSSSQQRQPVSSCFILTSIY